MTNTPPGAIARAATGFAFAGSAAAASIVNVTLPLLLPATMDGVALGVGSTILLTAQTAASANSLYTFRPINTNSITVPDKNYDASGVWTSTFPAGVYYWVKGINAISIEDVSGRKLTETGTIQLGAGSVTFKGTPLALVTDGLYSVQAGPGRHVNFDQSAEFTNGMMVHVTGGTANSGTWQYTGITNPVLGTTSLPWSKISSVKSAAITIPGQTFTNTAPASLAVCSHISA